MLPRVSNGAKVTRTNDTIAMLEKKYSCVVIFGEREESNEGRQPQDLWLQISPRLSP
jgi:hypothetical protein